MNDLLGIAGRNRRRIGSYLGRHRLLHLLQPRPQRVPIRIRFHGRSLEQIGVDWNRRRRSHQRP